MERDQGNFKAETYKQEAHSDQCRVLEASLPGNQFTDRLVICASRTAEYECDAVKQECRGERSQKEIFQRGFIRTDIVSLESRKNVSGDRKNFYSYEGKD